jgi:hypothetical protein
MEPPDVVIRLVLIAVSFVFAINYSAVFRSSPPKPAWKVVLSWVFFLGVTVTCCLLPKGFFFPQ